MYVPHPESKEEFLKISLMQHIGTDIKLFSTYLPCKLGTFMVGPTLHVFVEKVCCQAFQPGETVASQTFSEMEKQVIITWYKVGTLENAENLHLNRVSGVCVCKQVAAHSHALFEQPHSFHTHQQSAYEVFWVLVFKNCLTGCISQVREFSIFTFIFTDCKE
jgi:hypothetical protein